MGEWIVGVDDSDGARRALEWAGQEAALRGDRLTLVTVVHDATLLFDRGVDPQVRERLQRATMTWAEELLWKLADTLPADIPAVRREVRLGSPAGVLVERAEGATGLVVGSRGRGGFAGLLLGSVSQQVTLHAACPVVVVPDRPRPTRATADRAAPVVVGMDGSANARRALERAVEEAAVRDAFLEVVIVSALPPSPVALDRLPTDSPSSDVWTAAPQLAGLELSRQLRTEQARAEGAWQAEVRRVAEEDLRRMDVDPTRYRIEIVTGDHPARTLITVATGAELLVVGSRGRGGFAGLLAGSVSQHCVRHATVPVMVVPPA